MALASRAYRDPMEILSAKQSRENRQQRERVTNSPLPEFPRRWIEPEVKRQTKSFAEFLAEETAPKPRSAAWEALESLFV
jgi:hypothetical protein